MSIYTWWNLHTIITTMPVFRWHPSRPYRTPRCWYDIINIKHENSLDLQHYKDQVQMIRERLKTTQDGQKSYAVRRRRGLEFLVGDMVFLRCLPVKACLDLEKR